jgi:hypothetical protein
LTLDGHCVHSSNIEVTDFAGGNDVHIACLPLQSTHQLHPLDFSFIQFVKTNYAQEVEICLKTHPNVVATHYHITGLICKAYLKSATAALASNGFRKAGLYPCKHQTFDEHDPGRI